MRAGHSSIVEVGAYCGRSTLYLAYGLARALAAGAGDVVIFSVDHHHGSEENQAGWAHHDHTLVDPATGRIDTLGSWRRSIEAAGAEDLAVAVVGDSSAVAARLEVAAGLVFIDGGHGEQPAWADYLGWAPRVVEGGLLAIHDVFEDPAEGGRPPFEIYRQALDSGEFTELGRGRQGEPPRAEADGGHLGPAEVEPCRKRPGGEQLSGGAGSAQGVLGEHDGGGRVARALLGRDS